MGEFGSMNRRDFIGTTVGAALAVPSLKVAAAVSVAATALPVVPLGTYAEMNAALLKRAEGLTRQIPERVALRSTLPQLMEKALFPVARGDSPVVYSDNPRVSVHISSLYQTVFASGRVNLDRGGDRTFDFDLSRTERNLIDSLVDEWEARDMQMYCSYSKHKLSVGSAGDVLFGPRAEIVIEELLRKIYHTQVRNGAGECAEVFEDETRRRPLFIIICSDEALGQIRGTMTPVKAPSFTGKNAEWLQKRLFREGGTLVSMAGFVFLFDPKMPRHDMVDGAWQRRDFYSPLVSDGAGPRLSINPLYHNAASEDMIVWSRNVLTRLVPQEHLEKSGGNGVIQWRNTLAFDETGEKYRSDPSSGCYPSKLQAAYMPEITEWGWVIRQRRVLRMT